MSAWFATSATIYVYVPSLFTNTLFLSSPYFSVLIQIAPSSSYNASAAQRSAINSSQSSSISCFSEVHLSNSFNPKTVNIFFISSKKYFNEIDSKLTILSSCVSPTNS